MIGSFGQVFLIDWGASADENNEPLTLAQFLEEIMKKEEQKVLPGCS